MRELLRERAVFLAPECAGTDENALVSCGRQSNVPECIAFQNKIGECYGYVFLCLFLRELDFHEGAPRELHAQAGAWGEEEEDGTESEGQ